VYDNQLGDADDVTATIAIGGGSIVVHDSKTKAHIDYSLQAEPSVEVAVYPNPRAGNSSASYIRATECSAKNGFFAFSFTAPSKTNSQYKGTSGFS
jgi:hypothetical protein